VTPTSATFIDDDAVLSPGDAAAAILVTGDDRIILQLRDDKPGIFFPGHWGCFGGAIEDSDPSALEGLRREIKEELGLSLPAGALTYFSKFTFDMTFAGIGHMDRTYFVAQVSDSQLAGLRLGEGAEMKTLSIREALLEKRMVPYDGFALWMYYARHRLKPRGADNG
jgi:8-oxo-dGTP pyrophosphatase MutT (NUDIX family)